MRLTRTAVAEAVRRVRSTFRSARFRRKVLRCARSRCRARKLRLRRTCAPLDHIHFFDAGDGDHWAHTDGASTWINQCRHFTPELLYWTLLHEALHGALTREGGVELSEWREHEIMRRIDPRLL